LDEMAIMALAGDPASKILVAGLHQNGVFRSADGGKSWERSDQGLAARSMSTLLVSPGFTADHTLFASGIEDGVLRSSDSGKSWERVSEGLPGPQVLSLSISPRFAEDKTLLAALAEGLFCTADAGTTWTQIGPGDLKDPR